jgi:hypothetical protein
MLREGIAAMMGQQSEPARLFYDLLGLVIRGPFEVVAIRMNFVPQLADIVEKSVFYST